MSITIVLADDHEIVLEGLHSLLAAEEGFEVVGEAKRGVEALELVRKLQPDILVLDIGMPDLDGIEVAEQIRTENHPTKILALSMHSERDYVVEMFRAGARGYLLKESALIELLKAIKTVHEGKRYLSDELINIVVQDIPSQEESALSKLTEREKEILQLILDGRSSKEIAFELNLSSKTVDGHRQHIMKKLKMENMIELTKFAIREGLIKP